MNMKYKSVMRYSREEKLFRVCRIIWTRGKGPGVGGPDNYDAKLSLAFRFSWMPIRIRYTRSYGGRFV